MSCDEDAVGRVSGSEADFAPPRMLLTMLAGLLGSEAVFEPLRMLLTMLGGSFGSEVGVGVGAGVTDAGSAEGAVEELAVVATGPAAVE